MVGKKTSLMVHYSEGNTVTDIQAIGIRDICNVMCADCQMIEGPMYHWKKKLLDDLQNI